MVITRREKTYTLIGRDGKPYTSSASGTLGDHRANKIYGRLDCLSALRWIKRGHYVRQRVFFIDEQTAIAAGYRPCAVCLPERYAAWRSEFGPSTADLALDGRAAADRGPCSRAE